MAATHSRSFTSLVIATAILALSGCKLEIRVPHGGKVVSSDGAYICHASSTCVIDVVDLFFDQTFIADPDPGFLFKEWKDSDDYLCPGETEPCHLSTAQFEGHDVLMAMLESDTTFYLQPRFSLDLTYCPEPELVVSPDPHSI